MESHWPNLPDPGQEPRWILGESAEGSKFRNLSGNYNWNFMTFSGGAVINYLLYAWHSVGAGDRCIKNQNRLSPSLPPPFLHEARGSCK